MASGEQSTKKDNTKPAGLTTQQWQFPDFLTGLWTGL
jgi:hypothetical protein